MTKGVHCVTLLAAVCACAIFNHSSAEPGGGTFQTFGPVQRQYKPFRFSSSVERASGAALQGFLPPRSSGKGPSGSSSRSYNQRPLAGRETGISGVFEPIHTPQQLRDPQLYVIDSGSSRLSGKEPAAGSLHRGPPTPFPSYGPPVGGSQRRVSHPQADSIRPAVGPRRKTSSVTYQSSLAVPSFIADDDSQRRISHHWQGGRSPAYGVIGRPAVVSSSKHAEPSHASLSGRYQASVRRGDVESAGSFGETAPVAVVSSSQGNAGRREHVRIQQTGGANKYGGSSRSRNNVGDHGRRVITSGQSHRYSTLPSRTAGSSIDGNDQGADDFTDADNIGFSGQRPMAASSGASIATDIDYGQLITGRQHQQRVYGQSSKFGHAGQVDDRRFGSHSGTWRTHGQGAVQQSVASAEVVMSADSIGQLQSIEDQSKFEQAPAEDNPRLVHADDNNSFKPPRTEGRLDFVKFGRPPGYGADFSSNQRHSDDVDGFQIAKRDEQFEKDDDKQRGGGGQRRLTIDYFVGPHNNDGVSSGSFGVARAELEKFGARKTSAIAEDAEDEVMTINRHGRVCGTRICGLHEACALINGVPVCVASNHHH